MDRNPAQMEQNRRFSGNGSQTIVDKDGNVTSCYVSIQAEAPKPEPEVEKAMKQFMDRIRQNNLLILPKWDTLGSMPA